MSDTMSELKPCPFCRATAWVHKTVEPLEPWRVECDKCKAILIAFETEAEAIAAWNRREPDYQELARELAEAIAECQPSCGTCEYDNTNDCDFHGERCRKEVWLDGVVLAKARKAGLLEEKP